MSGTPTPFGRWLRRGFVGGAVLGAIEAAERSYAVREFVRSPAELATFGALAFAFCLGTCIVIGLLAGVVAVVLDATMRTPVPRRVLRFVFGALLGLGGALWALFALTLTVRFDRIVGQPIPVVAAAVVVGAVVGLAWPELTALWRRMRAGRVTLGATALILIAGFVLLHLWNAHFAPQSSLGVHALADTVLAVGALALATLIPGGPRGRGLVVAALAAAVLLAWTDRTMGSDPVAENLLKTRGAVSARAVRMWSALLDLDGDGYAPALLVGGEDPDNLDPTVPPPLLAAPGPLPGTGADSLAAHAIEASPGAFAGGDAPHLVLLTIDACRADVVPPHRSRRLGALLPPRPNLEKLAPRAARFLVGYTPSAGTEDTFAAMFSGWDLPGILNGVPKERYLPARLATVGYEVRGFVNDPRFAVSSFESRRLVRYGGHDGLRMLKDAAAFLDSLPAGRPGFAWIHVMDLHADVLQPFAWQTFSHRAHLEHYARALARVDSMVGDFMAALDAGSAASRTLLVMTADHGEELGGHGHYHHNLSLYQPAIRVPLWIMGPGVVAGDRDARISLQALYPTLLEAGGVEPGEAEGRTLWPVLRGTTPASSDPWIYSFLPQRGFSQTRARYQRPELGQAALLDAARRHKVILRIGLGSWEAYDVAADSMERWNLAGSGATWPDSLRRRLEQMIRERSTVPSGTRAAPQGVLVPAASGPGSGLTGVAKTVAGTRQSASVKPGSGR